ncbi:4-hydroxy-tetrahydrodipicolinate synthase [Pirellulimonas nuda]|uniref:4-hydroxy-tetrahydrodipicolinate synthase n=1 Tax=Pirellulimonas nuda TaxID=2528009 RepID=A0A518DG87_9BACT|nr:dihydrodipicolinate synthase family protein [Pirellulimonas nuda]QDU90490.1 4-hydroxy-tetrahydrodipicolinate synthase [Pirellulimonas nuda]
MNDRPNNGSLHRTDTPETRGDRSAFRLIPATYTPMQGDGEIDFGAIPRYVEDLVANGIGDIFVNGTTGESLSLTTSERLRLVDAWAQHRGGLRMIVHVGDNCVRRSVAMAAHAEGAGADAVSCMSPTFFKPEGINGLLNFLSPIAAAAPATKFYYYYIPSMAGVPLAMSEFIAKAVERIPNFAGVKYTHENLEEFGDCLATWGDRIELFFGRDELLLPGMSIGAKAAVGSFYSIVPTLFQDLARRYFSGDSEGAVAATQRANRCIAAFKKVGVLAGGKHVLAQRGIGSGAARLPLEAVDPSQGRWLIDQLTSLLEQPAPVSQTRSAHGHLPSTEGRAQDELRAR